MPHVLDLCRAPRAADLLTGSQSTGTGSWAAGSLLSGTDTLWNTPLRYSIPLGSDRQRLNVGVGWGGFSWSSGFATRSEAFWSKGPMFTAQFRASLSEALGLAARVDHYPSNYTRLTSIAGDFGSHGSATTWEVGLRYRSDNLRVAAGYTYSRVNAGDVAPCPNCRFEWSGSTLTVDWQFSRR